MTGKTPKYQGYGVRIRVPVLGTSAMEATLFYAGAASTTDATEIAGKFAGVPDAAAEVVSTLSDTEYTALKNDHGLRDGGAISWIRLKP